MVTDILILLPYILLNFNHIIHSDCYLMGSMVTDTDTDGGH